MNNTKVLVVIADGIEEIESATIINVLRRAQLEVTVASVNNLQITASRKMKFTADCLIDDSKNQNYEMIILPGGLP